MEYILKLILFAIYGLNLVYSQDSDKENYTSCKIAYTYGYGYSQYFELPKSSYSGNGSIIFKFAVQAISDAHVLFSPTVSPQEKDPVYEIVLGAGRNTFSDIRRQRRTKTTSRANTNDLLSVGELRKFWVTLENGLISVGKEGSDIPFLTWQDKNPLDVKFISFCTWTGVQGKWIYDCENYNAEEKQILTTLDKLKRDLLSEYDPYAIPTSDDDVILINSVFKINYIDLDPKKSSITVKGKFKFSWYDPKTQWVKEDYENIEWLHLPYRQIWRPDFILYNAVGDGSSPMATTWMAVSHNGEVKWSPQANLESYCRLDLRDWPWDSHTCNIKLGLFSNQDSVNISQHRAQLDDGMIGSEWEINSILSETKLVEVPWRDDITDSDNDDSTTNRKTAMVLTISLKRKMKTYYKLLFVPIYVFMVILLCSFLMPSLSFERVFIQGISILLMVSFMLVIDLDLPVIVKNTPYILLMYSKVLLLASFGIIVSTWVLWNSRKKYIKPPPKIICDLVHPISRIFCCSSYNIYGELEDMSENLRNTAEDYWKIWIQIVDTIAFHVIAIGFVIIIVI